MRRPITGFDLDAEGHWRAILACGHRQHVRHQPPLISRPWVLSEEGRASMVGQTLDCLRCDGDVELLRTPRLFLRELRERDVPNLVELDADPEVVRYVDLRKPTTADASRAWIASLTDRFYVQRPGWGFWAAIEAASDRFIGWFHLKPVEADATAGEVGYRLRRDAWGDGFATEGTRALIDHAFNTLGLTRVFATALAANGGSIQVMRKCGMTLAREFTYEPLDVPAVEYALVRPPTRSQIVES